MNENGPDPLDIASGTVSMAIMTEHAAKINLAVVRPALDLWIRMQYSHHFEDVIAFQHRQSENYFVLNSRA